VTAIPARSYPWRSRSLAKGSFKRLPNELFAVLGPLIFGEVLVDPNQPEDLPSWGLKVEVRIRHFKYLDAEADNVLPHLLDVVGLQFQIGRFQELALIQGGAFILVEECDIEVAAQAKVVLLITLSRDLATQDITIERTDSIPFCSGNSNRGMVSKNPKTTFVMMITPGWGRGMGGQPLGFPV
jgi:hypothetical protein